MALYFTGNVYNDRGSEELMAADQFRRQGNMAEAERHYKKAYDLWDKGEKAYEATKRLAPNYVQTHHQMGLLYVKRAEGALLVGDAAKANAYYDTAYQHFRLYNIIDPVFVPNTDRMAQILIRRGDFEEAKRLYRKTLHYNEDTCLDIRKVKSEHVGTIYVSLAKVCYSQALQKSQNPFNPPYPEVLEALEAFKKATEFDVEYGYLYNKANNGKPQIMDAWKGYGYLLERLGRQKEAQAAYQVAFQINPNDPELKTHTLGR